MCFSFGPASQSGYAEVVSNTGEAKLMVYFDVPGKFISNNKSGVKPNFESNEMQNFCNTVS